MSAAIDNLLGRLERVKHTGSGWQAQCPAHEDRVASLSVAEGEDGRALVRCHAGCELQAVTDALGLTVADLFEPRRDECNRIPRLVRSGRQSGSQRVSEADIERYAQALLGNEKALQRLEELRGWTREIVERLGIGLDGERVTFPYRDAAGNLVGVGRYQPNPDKRGGEPKLKADAGSRRELFPAPESIESDGWLLLVEGEPDAIRATSLGLIAVAVPGVEGWRSEYAQRFAGARVVVCFDCDAPGRKAAQRVAAELAPEAAEVRLLELDPERNDGYDLSDYAASAMTADERDAMRRILLGAAELAPRVEPAGEGKEKEHPIEPTTRRPSQATLLVEFAAEAELFRTAEHEPYALLPADGHTEVWSLKAGPFRRWLQRRYYTATGNAPNAQALQDALGVLEGKALFEGEERAVHVRLAEHNGAVYLDLADEHWRAVEVTARGWRVVSDPPVRFRRPRGMLPLPEPECGGSLDELRQFVNVADADWPLLAAFAVAALRPRGPYPVLPLGGEQGSAKSTTARVLRLLVDPNEVPLRAEPRQAHDLAIAARNGWFLVFDNLSHLPAWLSDGFCRLATGGGFAARELYTDTDEVLFDAQRPLVLTGIGELATRSDLLDRALVLTLPRISDEQRRDEESFWRNFEEARSRLLGALLGALATALERLPDVQLKRLPRMADFARFAVAAEPAFGVADGAFMAAYAGNRAEAHELALEGSPLAEPVREVAAEGFSGTMTDLLAKLAEKADENAAKRKGWPANAARLSNELRRLAPNLRAVGVELDFDPQGMRRGVVVRTTPRSSVPSVSSVQTGLGNRIPPDVVDAADTEIRTLSETTGTKLVFRPFVSEGDDG